MDNLDFKSLPDEELLHLAETHSVREWPVGFVRELAHRNYRPISGRADLEEACKEWLLPTLEAATRRFESIAEDLRLAYPKFPAAPLISGEAFEGILMIPEVPEIDRMEIAAPELANLLVDHEMKELFKSLADSSFDSSKWTKVSAFGAFGAVAVGVVGLVLQFVLN